MLLHKIQIKEAEVLEEVKNIIMEMHILMRVTMIMYLMLMMNQASQKLFLLMMGLILF